MIRTEYKIYSRKWNSFVTIHCPYVAMLPNIWKYFANQRNIIKWHFVGPNLFIFHWVTFFAYVLKLQWNFICIAINKCCKPRKENCLGWNNKEDGELFLHCELVNLFSCLFLFSYACLYVSLRYNFQRKNSLSLWVFFGNFCLHKIWYKNLTKFNRN